MRTITIGRSFDNDIVIENDGLISRHHAKITCDDSGIFSIVDLGSKNGTYVNGRKITAEVILSSRDTVKIGNTVLPWKAEPVSTQKTIEEQKSMVDTEISKDNEQKSEKMTYSWIVKK